MKKCGSILCVCAMVLSMMSAAVPTPVSAETEGDFAYAVLSDGMVQITAYTGSAAEVIIPSTLGGRPVTDIGMEAFRGCTAVESVVIPDSVANIWYRAFYGCAALQSVILGNGVTRVCEQAFHNTAYYNDSSRWENGVLYIGPCLVEASDALGGTYVVRQGTAVIADYAFADCAALTSVTVPDGVTSIGMRAFEDCSALETAVLSDGITRIGSYAFRRCGALQSLTIPVGVTIVEDYTFDKCSSLQSAVIPDGVTRIGVQAFGYCTSLQSMMIPHSVTGIAARAFCECYDMTDVYYGGTEEEFAVIDIALDESSALTWTTVHYGVTWGDFDGNGAVDMMDALYVYGLFSAGTFPTEKIGRIDADSNGTVNMLDCLKLFSRVSGLL